MVTKRASIAGLLRVKKKDREIKDAPPPYHHQNPFNDGHTCDLRAHEVSTSLGKRYLAVKADYDLQNDAAKTTRMRRYLRSRLARDYQVAPARVLDTADDPLFLLMMHYWYYTASEHHKVHHYCLYCRQIYEKVGLWLHNQLGPIAARPVGEVSLFWIVLEFGKLRACQDGETRYEDSVILHQADTGEFSSMAKKLQRDRNEAVAICGEELGLKVIDEIEKVADRYFSKIDGPNSFQLLEGIQQSDSSERDVNGKTPSSFGSDTNLGWGATRKYLCSVLTAEF